jgi:hypothetical protein
MSEGGEFRIVGPVSEPGFRGYKLLRGGEHVATRVRLKDAKRDAEALDKTGRND